MLPQLEADRALLASIQGQIFHLKRSLQKELTEAQRRLLVSLRSERFEVRLRLDSYKYPILTIPNEILTEIFLNILPPYPEPAPLYGPHSPLSLTHICRQWRAVALSSRVLWKAIAFNLYKTRLLDSRRCNGWDIFLEDLLGRSGHCPLTIEIDSTWYRSLWNSNTLSNVLSTHARWEHAKIYVDDEPFAGISGSMPLLQSLELSLGSPSPDAFTSCDMPMLRTAVLIDDSTLTVDLPWAQLTSLSLRFGGSESFDILQKTPRLVHCDLWLRGDDHESGCIDIHLPCLESLVLFHAGRYLPVVLHHPGLLDLFRVPALVHLIISEFFLEPKPFETLRSFISTSASNLRHITITCRTNQSSKTRSEASFRRAFPNFLEFSFEFEDDAAETDSEDYESEDESEDDAPETDSADYKSEDEVDEE